MILGSILLVCACFHLWVLRKRNRYTNSADYSSGLCLLLFIPMAWSGHLSLDVELTKTPTISAPNIYTLTWNRKFLHGQYFLNYKQPSLNPIPHGLFQHRAKKHAVMLLSEDILYRIFLHLLLVLCINRVWSEDNSIRLLLQFKRRTNRYYPPYI